MRLGAIAGAAPQYTSLPDGGGATDSSPQDPTAAGPHGAERYKPETLAELEEILKRYNVTEAAKWGTHELPHSKNKLELLREIQKGNTVLFSFTQEPGGRGPLAGAAAQPQRVLRRMVNVAQLVVRAVTKDKDGRDGCLVFLMQMETGRYM